MENGNRHRLPGWWLGDDGQGLEMLKEAVAMIAQRRVPTADLVKHLVESDSRRHLGRAQRETVFMVIKS